MMEDGNQQIDRDQVLRNLESFRNQDRQTHKVIRQCICRDGTKVELPVFVNHFWLREQRAGLSLHRVAYRGMFSPLLARFFIEGLSRPGDIVYDPTWAAALFPSKQHSCAGFLLGQMPTRFPN